MELLSKLIAVAFLSVVAFLVEIETGYKVSGEDLWLVDNLQNWYCLEAMKTSHFVVTVIGMAAGAGAVVGIRSEFA